MNIYQFSFIFLWFGVSQVVAKQGKCVMSEPCFTESEEWKDHNCFKPRPASSLAPEQNEAFEKLKSICPHLVTDGRESPLCCTPYQVFNLGKRFEIPEALLGRCPACLQNFKRLFCDFACSPNQDDFVDAESTFTQKNMVVIKEVAYYINKTFVDETYDSCKNVEAFYPGTFVMDFMCGIPAAECTAQKWLDYVGTSINKGGFAPYQINHHLTNSVATIKRKTESKVIRPYSARALRCSESAGNDNRACSCVDCKEPQCSEEPVTAAFDALTQS